MKTFTLLAVTGGLFFNSLCLNNGDAKKHKAFSKANAKHCVKKCCKNIKTTKETAFNISKAV